MSEAALRKFPLADVISVGSGYLVSAKGISAVYEVLNFMTGESIYTHQIPRVSREAAVVLVNQHPFLAIVFDEAKAVTKDNWAEKVAGWEARYGAEISIKPMSEESHERIDPLSELSEKVGPDKIVVA